MQKHVSEVLAQSIPRALKGSSELQFAPGIAGGNSRGKNTTIVVALVGLDDETRQSAYDYFYSFQLLVQRVRIAIFTDGHDLKLIKKYGWMCEHVMQKADHNKLQPFDDWAGLIVGQLRDCVSRLDAQGLFVVSPDGIDREDHNALIRLVGHRVPFESVVCR